MLIREGWLQRLLVPELRVIGQFEFFLTVTQRVEIQADPIPNCERWVSLNFLDRDIKSQNSN